MLFEWHQMLANGRRDLHDIGRYRTHPEPMQIVSGAVYAPKVHFEAPPSSEMLPEMDRFIAWFNDTAPEGKSPLPALLRAGPMPGSADSDCLHILAQPEHLF